jgi:AraC family transcriptional regulator
MRTVDVVTQAPDSLRPRGVPQVPPVQVHLTSHLLAIDAQSVRSGPTRRPAAVILWSDNGRPFKLSDPARGVSWEGNAGIVAPHFVRAINARDCELISLNFEPGHPFFSSLCSLTRDKGVIPVDPSRVKPYGPDLRSLISSKDSEELDRLANFVAGQFLPVDGTSLHGDARIRDIVARLESELSAPPSVLQLARWVGLSGDRLSHLFVEQVGIPVRSFIVWRRYRRALSSLQTLPDLTAVAHSVGFYDHAQMTRSFVRFFGYLPSVLRQRGFAAIHGKFL